MSRTRNKTETKIFACDFETTVYAGQTSTEVWASALCELGAENAIIHHSIGETMQYFEELCEKCNVLAYYHNLKFDGHFILSWLIKNKKFSEASYTVEENGVSHHIWEDRKSMKAYSYQYAISAKGAWYTITIKFKNHKLEIRDSLKLMPFALKQLAKAFNTKHQKLEMEYKGYRYAGCAISKSEQEYIKNDVLVLKEALEIIFAQGHKRLTIGACCLSEYKAISTVQQFNIDFPRLDEIALDETQHKFNNADAWIRKSYRGGWCYVVKGKENRILKNGFTIDVNSLYPSVMHSSSGNRYPVGSPTFWTGDYIPAEAQVKDKYYFVHIKTRFYLRKGYLPFVQIKNNLLYNPRENLETSDYRDKSGKHHKYIKIAETGEIQDTRVDLYLTMTDYKLLQEHYNLKECEIIDGCYFNTSKYLFDEYINKYRDIKVKSKGAIRQIAKLFLNNLYGKMATSPDSSYKIAYTKNDGSLGFYTKDEQLKKTVFIAVGSAVTSYARNFTIRVAQQNYYGADKGGFAYADTDSCHIDDMSIKDLKGVKLHDTAFSCWKAESCWNIAIFARQKTYVERVTHGDLKKLDKAYYNVKCAGMPDACKKLFIASLEYAQLTNDKLKELLHCDSFSDVDTITQAKLDFLSVKRDLTDFKVGLRVPGKLTPRAIEGGVILEDGYYTMTKRV